MQSTRARLFARELEAHLPVHVDRVLLRELAAVGRRAKRIARWARRRHELLPPSRGGAALERRGIPVIALLAEAHLETLHQLRPAAAEDTRRRRSAEPETAHNLEHSIANASLPNIVLAGASRPPGRRSPAWCGAST